jgi:hypothetical protein
MEKNSQNPREQTRSVRLRPSPALVLSCVSLFVALSGSAVALSGHDTVRSDDIKDGQVKRPDLRASAVGSPQVADDSLGAADLAPDSVGSSEMAINSVGRPEIAVETIGAEELRAIDEVTQAGYVLVDATGTVTATCPAGEQIISGGFATGGASGTEWTVRNSRRSGNGWAVTATNPGAGPDGGNSLTAYAYCLTN